MDRAQGGKPRNALRSRGILHHRLHAGPGGGRDPGVRRGDPRDARDRGAHRLRAVLPGATAAARRPAAIGFPGRAGQRDRRPRGGGRGRDSGCARAACPDRRRGGRGRDGARLSGRAQGALGRHRAQERHRRSTARDHQSYSRRGGVRRDRGRLPHHPPGRGDRGMPRRSDGGGGSGDHPRRAAGPRVRADRHVRARRHLRRGAEGRDLPRRPVRRSRGAGHDRVDRRLSRPHRPPRPAALGPRCARGRPLPAVPVRGRERRHHREPRHQPLPRPPRRRPRPRRGAGPPRRRDEQLRQQGACPGTARHR